MEPTKCQAEVLKTIISFWQKHGYAPTLREISNAIGSNSAQSLESKHGKRLDELPIDEVRKLITEAFPKEKDFYLGMLQPQSTVSGNHGEDPWGILISNSVTQDCISFAGNPRYRRSMAHGQHARR